MPPSRSAYGDSSKRLVLAFDIGTTYSGVAYSVLDPGQVPEIRSVTRFPPQIAGDSKIPTIIFYDQNGTVRAAGAEAAQEGINEKAEDEGWVKSEWFKLHMRPNHKDTKHITQALPPLPMNKSVVDLFADFMRYLYNCACTYIQESHANGSELWAAVEQNTDFVFAHPNGWGGAEQQQMRRAAIVAGLIPDTPQGHARVIFVSEGEAGLHFCIQSGLTTNGLKDGQGILIVDAGGGTIDLSAYSQRVDSKVPTFEEISPPECHFQGSYFVTHRAKTHFENLLRGSRFFDDVNAITEEFDKNSKQTFRSIDEPRFIRFGSMRDNEPKFGIRAGQLRLPGVDVASFFRPSVSCIIQAIKDQQTKARITLTSVFLVGGFAASEWLFSQLRTHLEPSGLNISRPDTHTNKAVAEGAVSFFLDHYVAVRVSKLSYGVECSVLFEERNREHVSRSSKIYSSLSGDQRLPGCFDVILQKVEKDAAVSETEEFRRSYAVTARNRETLRRIEESIQCYRGSSLLPRWMDVEPNMFSTLCIIEADTSVLSLKLKPLLRPAGSDGGPSYFRMEYDVVLSFGLTEMKAQIAWMENGEELRTPARVIYDIDK